MYYRTHCAVFHEASLSLTVRKYHCKICGKAVLGKQNIMKHALLNHDGKGAYQCQFCSKVHGLTEDRFPSIVRSVDYTFESYAGVEDGPRETDDPSSNDQGWQDESGKIQVWTSTKLK
ncbi:unnamed protein product [Nesidiocoris tenuis]|uniref:C2H2-type domain-containing protein n=1 Tax=Nesidiocoris tenuis TaxID=355587 RepID=A0A6H5GLV2_9HEMI|nr:unnamed protein product [Nesidiocoris tenuis]